MNLKQLTNKQTFVRFNIGNTTNGREAGRGWEGSVSITILHVVMAMRFLPVTRQRIAAPVATSPLPLHEFTNRYKITRKNETSIPKKPKQLAA